MTLPGHEPDQYAAQAGEIEMIMTLKERIDDETKNHLIGINEMIKTDLYTDEERLAFVELLLTGICKHCGRVTDQRCHCYNEE